MNQIRILKNQEQITENEIEIKLDSKQKLAFDIDIDYLTTLAMEHLVYKFEQSVGTNRKAFKIAKRFFGNEYDEISNIISENFINMIETLATLIKRAENMQQMLEGLNSMNLEAYIFTLISEIITSEMFDLFKQTTKKDELN